MRRTTCIFSSSTSKLSRAALSLKPYFVRRVATILPSRALCSLPRRVLSTIVEGPDPGAVLLELPAKQVMVCGLPGEAVPVLRQHHGDAAGGHEVPYTVHTGALQRCSA